MRPTTTHYALGTPPVTGVGIGVSRERLDEALAGPFAAVVFDDAGTDEIAALVDGLVDTDFARENLDRLLTNTRVPEDWRVGEGLAECLLVACRSCHFPWPGGRDERKRGSSLPGADLVGSRTNGANCRSSAARLRTTTATFQGPVPDLAGTDVDQSRRRHNGLCPLARLRPHRSDHHEHHAFPDLGAFSVRAESSPMASRSEKSTDRAAQWGCAQPASPGPPSLGLCRVAATWACPRVPNLEGTRQHRLVIKRPGCGRTRRSSLFSRHKLQAIMLRCGRSSLRTSLVRGGTR